MASLIELETPVEAVSESVRERETFRYDPSLASEFSYLRDGNLLPGSKLANSRDATLTGLAQLGAYQTGTERAFISLFDANHQYIIAETAPSMRIAPNLAGDSFSHPLALCGSAIPRSQGTCDHVLYLQATSKNNDAAELPLSFVPNLATDPRFSSRPYCQFGEAGQFYAAVPIRTRRGINIGAYCVMSQKRPQIWNDESSRSLRDVSSAVMDYLEQRRTMTMSRVHERLNRGLGFFIEGKSNLDSWQTGTRQRESAKQFKNGRPVTSVQKNGERDKQDTFEGDEAPSEGGQIASQVQGPLAEERHDAITPRGAMSTVEKPISSRISESRSTTDSFATKKDSNPTDTHRTADDEPQQVFSRAANIIREAYEVDGCVFMDVAVGAYTVPSDTVPKTAAGQLPSTSSGDDGVIHDTAADALCDFLGFSTSDGSSIDGDKTINQNIGKLPGRFLAKLLRRYPNGRIFNFDGVGDLQSTDSSEEEAAPIARQTSKDSQVLAESKDRDDPVKLADENPFSRKREGTLIHKAFPSARSVAFIPMRDFKGGRWLAGGFVYTLSPTRIFSSEGELTFLRAFEKAITSELLRLETEKIEKAKSDALGSLSHELRSPLHGIILGTELLNDTELSGFQGNTTHMIETCGRTLLDTIDHLLDYSKVNSLPGSTKQALAAEDDLRPSARRRKDLRQASKKLFANIRIDGIIEEVAQGVFAGFNFQHKSIRQLARQPEPKSTYVDAHRQLDAVQALEQLSPGQETSVTRDSYQFGMVSVYLCIDPTCDWAFYTQPGAIRRIFMNLFGNSLKYTTDGYIRVTLTQEPLDSRRPAGVRVVKLVIQDTGIGMGEQFIRHGLFKPFSQEDELSPGTGLGLSLVRKMVSQLQGRIHVQSERGIGTTVTVRLPLERPTMLSEISANAAEDDTLFEEQLQQLRGLRVGICGFGSSEAHGNERDVVLRICREWLKMEVVDEDGNSPDVVLRSGSALPDNFDIAAQLARTPNVVVCKDALTAYQQLVKYESLGLGGIFEFISQPWMAALKTTPPVRPQAPRRAQSLQNGKHVSIGSPISVISPPLYSDLELGLHHESKAKAECEPLNEKPSEVDATGETSRVLLVDDNRINLKILAAYMTKLGCPYEMVVNGKEAVDAYIAHPEQFAAILMDISMPVMDGLEATRLIRAHEQAYQLKRVAILALTGLGSKDIHREASDSGIDVFLTKPVRLKVLGEELSSIKALSALSKPVKVHC
ncbi:hypothetical protein PWT90_00442 [Aphanocladium album]|nr:hypothetical protein PWT90_00442 [Aphanocladium album]